MTFPVYIQTAPGAFARIDSPKKFLGVTITPGEIAVIQMETEEELSGPFQALQENKAQIITVIEFINARNQALQILMIA